MDDKGNTFPPRSNDYHNAPVVAQSLRSAASTLNYLSTENDRLESENFVLRKRIELLKKNCDLKTATVLSSIITWMDEKKTKGKENTSDRPGSPYRPTTPVLNDSALKFLQSQSEPATEDIEEPPRFNQPSVRFDTSRNTSRSPTNFGQSASAFSDYDPASSFQKNAPSSQSALKTSFLDRSGILDNDSINKEMGRSAMSGSRSAYSDQLLNESMLGPQSTSSIKAGASFQRSTTSSGIYDDSNLQGEDFPRNTPSDTLDEKKLNAKLARFSRPVDQIIGIRADPTRYYQGIMELKPTRRLIGEIAFQLDRRILDYVFSYDSSAGTNKAKKKRYYGYTVTHIFDKIRAESKDANGIPNSKRELAMRYRLEYLMKRLAPVGYKLDYHAGFAQEMVNKYGLLSSPPERKTLDNFGLEDPRVLRMLISKLMIFDDELKNTLVLLDCLCLMAHEDSGPLFKW